MISLPQGREPTPSYPASPNSNHSPANEMALVTHDPHLAAVTIAAHTQLSAIESQALSSVASSSTSPTRTSRSTSSRQSAASSLFIPRTSHNSQGIRKPLNKCSLLELNTMFEKLSNIVMVSSQNQFSNKVNLKRVKTDLEEIKRRIDYLEGIKGLDGAMKNTHISNGENLQQTNGNGKGKERELDYRGASSDINSKSLDQALQDLSIDGVKSNTSPKLSRAAQMELKREENSCSGTRSPDLFYSAPRDYEDIILALRIPLRIWNGQQPKSKAMLLSFADTLQLEHNLHLREKEEALEREESLRRLGLINKDNDHNPSRAQIIDSALRSMGRHADLDGERDMDEDQEVEDGDFDFKERFGSSG